jgi:hypothetical protein
MNHFNEDLAASHKASDLPFWEECYRKAFPDFKAMVDHRENGDHQGAGIDRSIVLWTSKRILIDEKVRWRNEETGIVYEDIALERWSNWERKIPGWVVKPLRCDFIAYAIAPIGMCYMLPVLQLQVAWKCHESEWTKRKEIDAENPPTATRAGYTTISYPVGVKELFSAMGKALWVEFDPFEKVEVAE